MMSRTKLGSLALLCLALGCSSSPREAFGGDTHWLAACTTDDDCGDASCVCGTCSTLCDGHAECGSKRPAGCYALESPGVMRFCASGMPEDGDGHGLCLAQCEQGDDCSSGQRCLDGACVNSEEDTFADVDAGPLPSSVEPVSAADFADLRPDVSLDEPVASPRPSLGFEGPAEALVGIWRQRDCGEAPQCLMLDIHENAAGVVQGQLHWELGQTSLAPFDPGVIDPDQGYPIGFPPNAYWELVWEVHPGQQHEMLDARFDGEVLRFWISPVDLWEGWCALQTSYAVPDGEPPYQCVPPGAAEDASQSDIGPLGKLALCTSEASAGTCEVDGMLHPCNCLDEEGNTYYLRARCSPAMCHCDADACRANLHAARLSATLTFDGKQLAVTDWYETEPGVAPGIGWVLEREAAP